MSLQDTADGYGLISRLAHWGMAVVIFAMFPLGVWMVGLDYYSPYYTSAPNVHRSVGMLLLGLLVARFLWRIMNVKPRDPTLSPFEQAASLVVHWGFYALLLGLFISGYLISTPDGRPIDVFGWFSVPSLIQHKGLEDVAGRVHKILAYASIGLAILHAAAALKHHFVDKSPILTRMWFGPTSK